MGKKKKFRFRIRYLLIIAILYLIFRAWLYFVPVKGFNIEFSDDINDYERKEIMNLISRMDSTEVEKIRAGIMDIEWVKNVGRSKLPDGRVIMKVRSRQIIGRIKGENRRYIDGSGNIFSREIDCDSVPLVVLKNDSLASDVKISLEEIGTFRDIPVSILEISGEGLVTEGNGCRIFWGDGDYLKKYRLIKKIKKKRIELKGEFDLRFENMLILRR